MKFLATCDSMVVSSTPGRRTIGWLVLGWMTVFGRAYHTWVCYQPPRLTQPPTFCGTENEYRPKCGDALRLGSDDDVCPS